jgi:hypothetical protein
MTVIEVLAPPAATTVASGVGDGAPGASAGTPVEGASRGTSHQALP